MNIFKKLSALVLAVLMLASMPLTAFAEVETTSPFKSGRYVHQSQFDGMNIINGLDLSKYDKNVDFAKIKKAGVEYVILRAGYRGYGKKGTLMNDERFEEYYENAKAVGILVGVYFYSQALNKEEAIEEADFVIDKLEGRELDLPIAYDYEFADNSEGRLNTAWRNGSLNKRKMTDNAIAFCERVKDKGYSPMVYANKTFLNTNLNHITLEDAGYPIWLAHYTNETDYNGKFSIWQYSSTGKVNGVKDVNVDCNFMYVDPINLGKPRAEVTYNGMKTIRLSWDKVSDADGYELMRKSGDRIIPLGETTETNFKLTDLTPATNYYIRIRAYREIDGIRKYGDYAKSVKATTKPAKVKELKAVSRTDKSITLGWKKEGSPSEYNVYMRNSDGEYDFYGKTKSNSISVIHLEPNTYYSFKVEALKDDYVGAKSSSVGKYTRLRAPRVRSVSSPGKKKLTISWKKNSEASGYQVQWTTSTDFSYNTKSVRVKDANKTSKTIETYRTNEYYSIRVRAYVVRDGSRIYSSWSEATRIKVR